MDTGVGLRSERCRHLRYGSADIKAQPEMVKRLLAAHAFRELTLSGAPKTYPKSGQELLWFQGRHEQNGTRHRHLFVAGPRSLPAASIVHAVEKDAPLCSRAKTESPGSANLLHVRFVRSGVRQCIAKNACHSWLRMLASRTTGPAGGLGTLAKRHKLTGLAEGQANSDKWGRSAHHRRLSLLVEQFEVCPCRSVLHHGPKVPFVAD
jgi:hypothetical protein